MADVESPGPQRPAFHPGAAIVAAIIALVVYALLLIYQFDGKPLLGFYGGSNPTLKQYLVFRLMLAPFDASLYLCGLIGVGSYFMIAADLNRAPDP